jgi:hypothetical protein
MHLAPFKSLHEVSTHSGEDQDSIEASKFFASRLLRLIEAKKRSTTQRLAMTAKPTWLSDLRTTPMCIGLALATRGPA